MLIFDLSLIPLNKRAYHLTTREIIKTDKKSTTKYLKLNTDNSYFDGMVN